MRKFLAFCLVFTMIFTLVACDSKNTNNNTTPSDNQNTDNAEVSDSKILEDFGNELKIDDNTYVVKNIDVTEKVNNADIKTITVELKVEAENDLASVVTTYMMEYVYDESYKQYLHVNTERMSSLDEITPKSILEKDEVRGELEDDWEFKDLIQVDAHTIRGEFERTKNGEYGSIVEKAITTYRFNTSSLKWEYVNVEISVIERGWDIEGVWYPVTDNNERDMNNSLSVEISDVTDSKIHLTVTWEEYDGLIFDQIIDYDPNVDEVFIVVTNTEKDMPMITIEIRMNSVKVAGNKFMLETEISRVDTNN